MYMDHFMNYVIILLLNVTFYHISYLFFYIIYSFAQYILYMSLLSQNVALALFQYQKLAILLFFSDTYFHFNLFIFKNLELVLMIALKYCNQYFFSSNFIFIFKFDCFTYFICYLIFSILLPIFIFNLVINSISSILKNLYFLLYFYYFKPFAISSYFLIFPSMDFDS